jgi:DNA-directed RNA polymerase specialized sigma subunit
MALGADGPGFYRARSAIEDVKKTENKSKTYDTDIRIEIEGNEMNGVILNTVFSLMYVLEMDWSERQREIIFEYERCGGSQKECAERLGISQSSVHRGLSNGHYYTYKKAKETLNNVLSEIGGDYV